LGQYFRKGKAIVEDIDLFGEPVAPKSDATKMVRPEKKRKSEEQVQLAEERRELEKLHAASRLETSYAAFERSHLARNIPEQFSAVCDRIRLREIPPFRRPNHIHRHRSSYGNMLLQLSEDAFEVDIASKIEYEIDEVLVRFLALQKTVDLSVPTRDPFDAINKLTSSVNASIDKLFDADRDAAVRTTSPEISDTEPTCADDILALSSLAAKVTGTRDYLIQTQRELEKLKTFFNYKRGLIKSGRPSKYAMIFAVRALADIFERYNTRGLEAQVNEFEDGGRNGKKGNNHNARRYTGKFLSFVTSFYMKVVPEQANQANEGFADQVRKYARLRLQDPDAAKLLYEDDSNQFHVLEFMKRADALK
jgi:hypothetical protein